MKPQYLILAFALVVASCSSPGKKESKTTEQETSESSPAENATPKGAQLIATYDCLTCHKEREKLIGPAYVEVAKKYPNTPENVSMLADKIIKGGSGNWGQTPMTPHPTLSIPEAEEMVNYILTIK